MSFAQLAKKLTGRFVRTAVIKTNTGYCHCCRTQTTFGEYGTWLRDEYFCATCHSIPRQRATSYVLDKYFPGWEKLRLHEFSPSNDYISRWSSAYSGSHFWEGVPPGGEKLKVRCENLEHLTFLDNSFDLVVTQDVLEHVPKPESAAAEIMRVLKPGGAHVFTTPKYKEIRKSYSRDGMEPVYHGSPIGDHRSLVTWDYGDDFEILVWNWTKFPTCTYVTRDRSLGLDGEFLEVFVTRKLAHDLTLV